MTCFFSRIESISFVQDDGTDRQRPHERVITVIVTHCYRDALQISPGLPFGIKGTFLILLILLTWRLYNNEILPTNIQSEKIRN